MYRLLQYQIINLLGAFVLIVWSATASADGNDGAAIFLESVLPEKANCKLNIRLTDTAEFKNVYINRDNIMYYFDDRGIDSATVYLELMHPTGVALIINNHIEKLFQFYLEPGTMDIEIDVPNYKVEIQGGLVNAEYRELFSVRDSLLRQFGLPGVLNPYRPDFDSMKLVIRTYMPLIDSLSQIHRQNFFDTHPASFLTLEDIHIYLSFIFEDPGYDPSSGEKERLKQRFDKLDPTLSRYPMYQECLELFAREPVRQPVDPPAPLWKENK